MQETIKKIFTENKGILAADESGKSINKRFEALGIEQTIENHLAFRRVLIETPNLNKYISGIIFHDETFRQDVEMGKGFVKYCQENDIVPGIKVDLGLDDDKITLGIDGLEIRMKEYFDLGARFSKWRAVVDVKNTSDEIILTNMKNLAIYASIAQKIGIVPIVEPEVMYDGEHSIEECREKMSHVYDVLFKQLSEQGVDIKNIVLKTAMVLAGKNSSAKSSSEEIAKETSWVLQNKVPGDIGGVVFLSGGQTPIEATLNLNNILKHGPYNFPLTYSYSRALQDPVLKSFSENPNDISKIQSIFIDRLEMNTLALKQQYDLAHETGLSSNINQVTHSQDL